MAKERRRHPVAKIKGGWSAGEDALLCELVEEFGEGSWSPIARAFNERVGQCDDNGRIGKQCRERWHHHLRPDIKKDAWDEAEEAMLVAAHQKYGNRWSLVAHCIPGRSDNNVKNHWNATLRRKEAEQQPPCALKVYMRDQSLVGHSRKRPRRGGSPAGACGGGGTSAALRKRGRRPPSPDPSSSDCGSLDDDEPAASDLSTGQADSGSGAIPEEASLPREGGGGTEAAAPEGEVCVLVAAAAAPPPRLRPVRVTRPPQRRGGDQQLPLPSATGAAGGCNSTGRRAEAAAAVAAPVDVILSSRVVECAASGGGGGGAAGSDGRRSLAGVEAVTAAEPAVSVSAAAATPQQMLQLPCPPSPMPHLISPPSLGEGSACMPGVGGGGGGPLAAVAAAWLCGVGGNEPDVLHCCPPPLPPPPMEALPSAVCSAVCSESLGEATAVVVPCTAGVPTAADAAAGGGGGGTQQHQWPEEWQQLAWSEEQQQEQQQQQEDEPGSGCGSRGDEGDDPCGVQERAGRGEISGWDGLDGPCASSEGLPLPSLFAAWQAQAPLQPVWGHQLGTDDTDEEGSGTEAALLHLDDDRELQRLMADFNPDWCPPPCEYGDRTACQGTNRATAGFLEADDGQCGGAPDGLLMPSWPNAPLAVAPHPLVLYSPPQQQQQQQPLLSQRLAAWEPYRDSSGTSVDSGTGPSAHALLQQQLQQQRRRGRVSSTGSAGSDMTPLPAACPPGWQLLPPPPSQQHPTAPHPRAAELPLPPACPAAAVECPASAAVPCQPGWQPLSRQRSPVSRSASSSGPLDCRHATPLVRTATNGASYGCPTGLVPHHPGSGMGCAPSVALAMVPSRLQARSGASATAGGGGGGCSGGVVNEYSVCEQYSHVLLTTEPLASDLGVRVLGGTPLRELMFREAYGPHRVCMRRVAIAMSYPQIEPPSKPTRQQLLSSLPALVHRMCFGLRRMFPAVGALLVALRLGGSTANGELAVLVGLATTPLLDSAQATGAVEVLAADVLGLLLTPPPEELLLLQQEVPRLPPPLLEPPPPPFCASAGWGEGAAGGAGGGGGGMMVVREPFVERAPIGGGRRWSSG